MTCTHTNNWILDPELGPICRGCGLHAETIIATLTKALENCDQAFGAPQGTIAQKAMTRTALNSLDAALDIPTV